MRLEAGAQFARYKVEASLGGGGMGHVYRAFDTQLQRRVALKILHAGKDDGDGAAAALILREARAAAALNHVNAVTVFEVGEHEGVPFLAMELVAGQPLRQLIARGDVLLARKVRWLLGIASALAAAHAAGIVHLDVKPENVIVRDDDIAKVLDFGIARRHAFDPEILIRTHADAERLQTLTNGSGSIVGTPRYMAPEQIGRGALDGRTDQFAWGVVAYELLAGQSPWPASESLYDLFSSILRLAPIPVSARRAEVPASISDVVQRALAKLPENRFPSMADVVAALARAAADLPTSPVSVPSWLVRPSIPSVAPTDTTEPVADPTAATVDVASIDLSPPPRNSDLPGTPGPIARPLAGDTVTQPSGDISAPVRPPPKNATKTRVAGAVMTLVLVVAALWAVSSRGHPPAAPVADAGAPACREDAQRSYAAGSRALRSGNWQLARKSFQDAAAEDPECAAAHARLVVIGHWTDPPSKTREALRRALDLADRLSERDRDLLHCYEAVLWATPPDEPAFAACLDRLSDARPDDAELAYIASDFSESPARMQALAQRALDLDPLYSDAWQALAVAYSRQENEVAALDALDQCVQRVTTSLDCLAQRAMMLRRTGRCADLEATARRWIARSPEATGAHYTLASALAAKGRPRAVVEEALAMRWAQMKGTSDAGNELVERAAFAALFGDFAGAGARARELDAKAKGAPDVEPRIEAALWMLDLALETGSLEEAGALASDLWSRKAAWDSAARFSGYNARSGLFEPQLLHVLRVAKRMPDAEIAAARSRWIEAARASHALGEEGLWLLGHAMGAETPEEAAEAARKMPAAVASKTSWTVTLPGLLTFAYAGRALLLADRTDDALPLLARASTSCTALEDPILHTQATLWYGEALAKKGDRDRACRAFSVVRRRWGAVAGSRTAREAAEQAATLRCPEP